MITQTESNNIKKVIEQIPSTGYLVEKRKTALIIKDLIKLIDHEIDAIVLYRIINNFIGYTFEGSSKEYISKLAIFNLLDYVTVRTAESDTQL